MSANVPRASRPLVAGWQGARTKAGGTPAVRSGPRIYCGGKPPRSREMCYNDRMPSFWSNRNLSGTRDALLVNGLATLAGCASIVLAIILDVNDPSFGPGLGVALSATGVLLVWSLTLAFRAWRRGERSGWCWAVMVLGVLETVLLGAVAYLVRFVFPFTSPFDWAYETGLIVFLPVGAVACLGALPVAWWRMRRAAKRDAKAGIERRRHWKRGLIWFCGVAALLIALLLPCPLFLYCCDREFSNYSYAWQIRPERHTWTAWAAGNTPVFVADPAAEVLALSSHKAAADLYLRALESGRVSKNRLLAEVKATNLSTQESAFQGLELADPEAALVLADQIGQGRITSSPNLLLRAGALLWQRGTKERIGYFLDQAATQSPPNPQFMSGLLRNLRDRPDCLPELTDFCGKDSPSRETALASLAQILPPKDLPRLWAEFLKDSDPLRRKQAIMAIQHIPNLNRRLAIVAACLESPDPAVRQELRQGLHLLHSVFCYVKPADPALVKRIVQGLLPVLDDADRNIRCAAARSLAWVVDDHGTMQKESTFFLILLGRLEGGKRVEATPEEQEMLESVRAAAKKWLDEHK
ncbi:MAG: hypothetical protein ABSE73_16060 [Planctomycetota bacterium]